MERSLITEYREMVQDLLANLNKENYAQAVKVASMAEESEVLGMSKMPPFNATVKNLMVNLVTHPLRSELSQEPHEMRGKVVSIVLAW